MRAIAHKLEDTSYLDHHIDELVKIVAAEVGRDDPRRGFEIGLNCEVLPYLLSAWRAYVQGPDDAAETWFVKGSPMGIRSSPVDKGIFPLYSDVEVAVDPISLTTEEPGAISHAERYKEAVAEVKTMAKKKLINITPQQSQTKTRCRGTP